MPAAHVFTFALRGAYGRLTPAADDVNMRMLVRTSVALAIAACALTGVAGAAPDPIGKFPGGWTHAEITVAQNGAPHTLIYDRGRVQQTTASSVVLRENDGSIVEIPVSPETTIRLNGRAATLADVKKKMQVQSLRIDGGPATLLRVMRGGR
jgi:hypothetical protein